MKTTVIIPTYNEAINVRILIERLVHELPELGILVVDDNSPDGTAQVVQDLAQHYPQVRLLLRHKKEGLGVAYRHAFTELRSDPCTHILMMDADLSHDPVYIPEMLKRSSGAQLVVGSRYMGRGSGTVGWELWRRLLSRLGNTYCRLVTGMPLHDCTAGFLLIQKDRLAEPLLAQLDASGYAFLMELKYLLWKNGARITEVPIVFQNRNEGESKISNHIIGEGLLAPWKLRFKKR